MIQEGIMPSWFIRRLTQADEHFLREMLYVALHVPHGQPPFPKEVLSEPEISQYVSDWGRKGDTGFVAVDARTSLCVGTAWIRLFTGESKGYGYVDDEIPELSMAVLPEYRGNGIGTDLIRHLIDEACLEHCALSLSVLADNPAVRLYQRLGFEVVRRDRGSLTMKKELNARCGETCSSSD
jgi:ribosomal protein S18 acetylase RimI-like enzyme